MLKCKSIFICVVFLSSLLSQGKMNSYGFGHFYKNQGNQSSHHSLVTLSPSFQKNVSLSNPSTWHNLNYSILSLSYSGNENSQNRSLINGYSELSNAYLIIPYKNHASIGIEISPYLNQMVSIKDSINSNYFAFNDTLTYMNSIDRYGGIMNFKIGSSYKIKNLISFGLRLNYLFGSSRHKNTINFGGSSIINTSRLIYNATLIEFFLHKNYAKKYDYYFMVKKTLKPLEGESHIKPLFDDVNGNTFYDDFDFPYFGDYKSDTSQFKNLHKPSVYSFGLNYLVTKNSYLSFEFQNDENNFDLKSNSSTRLFIPNYNWINNSKRASMSVIRFPRINSSTLFGGLISRLGITYIKHSMEYDKIFIEEYGASISFGFKFKPVGNQLDLNYYIGSREYSNSSILELAQQIQIGISLGDLWFVRRRQK